MKRTLILISIAALTSCTSYERIGDLTIVSNRNLENDRSAYVLKQRGAEFVAKKKNDDALEKAIDGACELHQGEYLMNVQVFVKDNGKKIKVIGDVWGYPSDTLK